MPRIDEQRRHALHEAMKEAIGPEPAETLMSMIPSTTWDELVTQDHLSRELERLEHKIEATLHREIRDLTRTLMLGLVGAMATMTSLCLAAISLQ